ncbi:MAG TPA: cation-translocating P-type ATPase, partial [Aquabacterium sp.]|nr:cation-translocating P-type ATPase [Aquabacterium sp.]
RPGGEDLPMVFSGSLVVRGHGLAEVTATGERSQMGQIGQALRQIETQPTVLNQQTRALVRLFAVLGVSVSVVVGGLYLWQRGDALGALLASITLAMSMLPQEFPLILTVFMAMGAWRISQRRVLVRRASAIEALGAATVLCTDKTGTLTLNRMTVAALHTADGQRWEAGEARLPEAFHALLEHGILASQREPFDPMEKAFWDLAATHLTDADREHLHPDWTLAHEYALTPDLLAMSHVWRRADRTAHVIAAKGAPEAVADLCHLPAAQLAAVRQQVEQMAARGLRVLGVARAECEAPPTEGTWPVLQHDFDFVFLGLVALVDPLRPEVRQAVQTCREAGIRVAMITGDYPVTALAIAGQAGIDTAGGVLRGEDIAALDDAALSERVRTTTVFARVMPEQKWRIVRACQANGDIVAMTGDGVNDAPSLKAADIGIAMGGRGTDVAREASDMVLLDDDFAAIAQATRLGRRIDDNLRKGMAFVLAVHVPIAGLSLLPLLTGWPLLFLPLHIALLELIIDPVCSVVFEAEPEEANLMQRPPRPADTPLLGPATMVWSALQGGVVMAVVGGLYVWALRTGQPEAEARTTAFLALVLGNGALILNSRPLSGGWWAGLRQHNPMLALVLGWPAVREVFQMARPTGPMLAVVLAAGVGCWLALLGVRGLQLRWLR